MGHIERRLFLAGLGATALTLPMASGAQASGLLSDILGKASDSALDKLAAPGAFYNDQDIRIGLPFIGGRSGLLGSLGSIGLFDGLIRRLNDAASAAAGVAKPVFRESIDKLSLSDLPGIVKESDGATRHLRESAGDTLHGKLRPLVDNALGKAGAYRKYDKLAAKTSLLSGAGITHDVLGKSVTEQALKGIFKYIGNEEAQLRANPLEKAGGLLKGLLGN
jgi:Protein of unknown function (DUF4197)